MVVGILNASELSMSHRSLFTLCTSTYIWDPKGERILDEYHQVQLVIPILPHTQNQYDDDKGNVFL